MAHCALVCLHRMYYKCMRCIVYVRAYVRTHVYGFVVVFANVCVLMVVSVWVSVCDWSIFIVRILTPICRLKLLLPKFKRFWQCENKCAQNDMLYTERARVEKLQFLLSVCARFSRRVFFPRFGLFSLSLFHGEISQIYQLFHSSELQIIFIKLHLLDSFLLICTSNFLWPVYTC